MYSEEWASAGEPVGLEGAGGGQGLEGAVVGGVGDSRCEPNLRIGYARSEEPAGPRCPRKCAV